ncbi:MAG: phycobilisome rod-core linker polypeptide [Cyanobacteria bacterium P01_A01_bin.116]
MQTLVNRSSVIRPTAEAGDELFKTSTPKERLRAVYRQLFKENRDLDFFHNDHIDSAYLNGTLTTRELVCQLLQSAMYRDYILMVNSNYRFVALTFERVLGRTATDEEQRTWASLLATEGLSGFAEALTSCTEYLDAYGDNKIPTRRSEQLPSSRQSLPALPKEASEKRYQGNKNGMNNIGPDVSTWGWEGAMPPQKLRKAGTVLAIAGALEVGRVLLTIIGSALSVGL